MASNNQQQVDVDSIIERLLEGWHSNIYAITCFDKLFFIFFYYEVNQYYNNLI